MKKITFIFHFIFQFLSLFINIGKDLNDSNLFSPNIYNALENYKNVSFMILFIQENSLILKNLEIHEKLIEMYIFFYLIKSFLDPQLLNP